MNIDTNGLRWFDSSPQAGDPTCTCSHCDQVIAGEVPLRLWNASGQEARLHQRCFALRTGAPAETEWEPIEDSDDFEDKEEWNPVGPCCACRRADVVARNLMLLPVRAPTPGTGWGCVVCGLPSDGALALLCDDCFDRAAPIVDICDGYTTSGRRASIEGAEPFEHRNIPH